MKYIVFVFEADKPRGGWLDVVKNIDGQPKVFASFKEAADVGRDFSQSYQVVELSSLKLIGVGGHQTGRKPSS